MNKVKNNDSETYKKLANLRQEIDQLDDNLWQNMQRRYKLVEEIINLKKEAKLEMDDLEREKEILLRIKKQFPELDIQFITKIYQLIFEHSKEMFLNNKNK
ncbi:chorismate mutase [Candidatus Woesearchaeota archaeon]|nr:chorismate mutase [Candidatus Woesearchaeota archaeon]